METIPLLEKLISEQSEDVSLKCVLDPPTFKTDELLSNMLLARIPLKKVQKKSKNRPSKNKLRTIKNSKKANRKKK